MSEEKTTVVAQEEKPQESKEALAKAEQVYKDGQARLLAAIGQEYAKYDASSGKALRAIGRKAAEYVSNAIAHAAESQRGKAFTGAIREIEAYLETFTDESIGVSRLLGVYGLATLIDDESIIGAISVSKLKVLLPLIQRDATAPELAYTWNDKAKDCADGFIRQLGKMPLTVTELRERVTDMLQGPTAEGEGEKGGKGGKGGKPKSAAAKATKAIASALKAAGDADQRKEAVIRAVKTEAISVSDISTALKAIAAEGRIADLKRIYNVARTLLERAAAKRDAKAEATAEAA